jgi:signal transduction histidine kinase
MAVTFRKARSSLLSTAKLNLEQSAIMKAETIQKSIKALQTQLAIASETAPLQNGSPMTSKVFLSQLQEQLPEARCLQLRDVQNNRIVASTCGDRVLDPISISSWPRQKNPAATDWLNIHTITPNRINRPAQSELVSQLNLLVSTPVYNPAGKLRYSLTAQAVFKQPDSAESIRPWLLQGYTIIIGQDGTFLAHPDVNRVGLNIAQEPAGDRFQNIIANVTKGSEKTGSRHLFGITNENVSEWIGGFSRVTIPITANDEQTWAVIAVTRMDSALQGLEEITQILLILTVGLLAAHLLAMLYMARDLALPIEQLGKYALRIHKRNSTERAPKNFRIRELNHLAEVLDNMVGRLEERAKELESAWQEAKAANQLKSEFLANTSHELRTPLNAIIGCIRLVKDDCCDTREEEVEFLEQADRAAIHLLKIINDLLDIQRIEEEKLPISLEVVDLRQVLKEAIDLEVVQIQQKGLQLTVPDLSDPILVKADPARLKQVLLNVIYNAVKFTDQGGITIETHLEKAIDLTLTNGHHHYDADDPSETVTWVIVTVQDTGIGIDPAQQHKLFRPFVMVDGSTTRKFEGTGLGLAISRNLVELMGGQITLHSAGVGQGTTVKIALPVIDTPSQADPPITQEALDETVTQPAMQHSTIL